MKNIVKKLNILIIASAFVLPGIAFANGDYGYYSGDAYTYDSPSYYSGDAYTYDYGYDSYYSGDAYTYDDYCYDCYSYDEYAYNDYYYDDYDYGCYSDCYPTYQPPVYQPPVYQPPVYNPPVYNDPLEVICRVSDTRIEEGERVTFSAEVYGGDRPYDYDWDGDISSSNREVSVRFDHEGNYHASVEVTDDRGRKAHDECPTVIVEEEEEEFDDFDIMCVVSDTRIEEGDRVTIEVDIDGGNSPFEIRWTGDVNDVDDFDRNDRSQRVRFDDEGRYDFEVRVRDNDGRVRTDDCPVIIVDDEDNNTQVITSGNLSNNTGNFASVDSVYLNQVPYTGPEDVAKAIGFFSLILFWSLAGAVLVRTNMKKKAKSKEILAFKEANKNA